MPPPRRSYPNPFLFVAISAASYAVFYAILQYRNTAYPASQQPRQYESPRIPPRHLNRDDNPKDN